MTEDYKGASLKGMLYLAMQQRKQVRIPYDEVWIVTDNDEGNAYKLNDSTLKKIEKAELMEENILNMLRENQNVTMNVRGNESQKTRIRYFLHPSDYLEFLDRFEDNEEKQSAILNLTHKNEDFHKLFHESPEVFFYDENGNFLFENNKRQTAYLEEYFDKNWRDFINIAYSCISFEYWILLHFEETDKPFYNSREILKYFDDKGYFISDSTAFEKGWFLYEKRENKVVKDFFKKAKTAIKNSFILSNATTQRLLGKHFFEVNPFSDVHKLAASLLNITIGEENKAFNHEKLGLSEIIVNRTENTIEITFKYLRNTTELSKNMKSRFQLKKRRNDNDIVDEITISNPTVIRQNDPVRLTITHDYREEAILHFEEALKNQKFYLLWFLS